MSRKRKSTSTDNLEVDTGIYAVEKIYKSKLVNGQLFYCVKWENYGEKDNTEEPELRLNCDTKLINFLVSHFDSNSYTNSISMILSNLGKYKTEQHILHTIDPLSTLASTTCFTGSVKFVNADAVNCKYTFLEYLRDYDQTYLLHSAMLPSEDAIDTSEEKYAKQLQYRQQVFPDYPFVRIVFPIHTDTVFYCPPPHANLIFEPVTSKMEEDRLNHLFVPKAKEPGFNDVEAFIRDDYFDNNGDPNQDPRLQPLIYEPKEKRKIKGMERLDYHLDPRFHANLELVQELARGWILRGGHDIEVDSPLLLMAGVLRSSLEAHRSLIHQGEQVAFTSFIEVPNTRLCLDRRQFYDFSKFIAHSCKPTCAVRLVHSGNKVPDLVVYNIVPLNKENDREITIDYFRLFTKDVREYFQRKRSKDGRIFGMYNENLDFVQCQCYSGKCRQVLYIDKSSFAKDQSKTKEEKLNNLEHGFFFPGMQVAESDKVWSIVDGKFAE